MREHACDVTSEDGGSVAPAAMRAGGALGRGGEDVAMVTMLII